MIITVCVEVCK